MTNTQSFTNIITSVPNGLTVTFCINVGDEQQREKLSLQVRVVSKGHKRLLKMISLTILYYKEVHFHMVRKTTGLSYPSSSYVIMLLP